MSLRHVNLCPYNNETAPQNVNNLKISNLASKFKPKWLFELAFDKKASQCTQCTLFFLLGGGGSGEGREVGAKA